MKWFELLAVMVCGMLLGFELAGPWNSSNASVSPQTPIVLDCSGNSEHILLWHHQTVIIKCSK